MVVSLIFRSMTIVNCASSPRYPNTRVSYNSSDYFIRLFERPCSFREESELGARGGMRVGGFGGLGEADYLSEFPGEIKKIVLWRVIRSFKKLSKKYSEHPQRL